jgi:hypothetical protein
MPLIGHYLPRVGQVGTNARPGKSRQAEAPNAEMRQHNAYHSFLVFLVLGCLLGEHPSHVGQ